MWVRFTILWADLVRHSPGSDRSSLEWGGLAGSGELDRLPTIDHRREAIDRRCRLNVIFGNGLRKLGVEKKIIPGGAGTFYSGQEKRDRCNVSGSRVAAGAKILRCDPRATQQRQDPGGFDALPCTAAHARKWLPDTKPHRRRGQSDERDAGSHLLRGSARHPPGHCIDCFGRSRPSTTCF